MSTQVLNGRYRLDSIIGQGGMGCVWRAHDTVLGREVAIKEVRPPVGYSEEVLQTLYTRATREARNAARIEHSSLVTIYDVVTSEDGRPWIVMKLLHHKTLQEHVAANGPLSQRDAVRLAACLLDVLEVIHRAGILHRDIKPSNIAWDPDGRVVLLDFGIAKHYLDTTLTGSGVIGTPSYMAPECITKDEVGSESDLWSVGAVLYFALTGKALFERTTKEAIMYAIAYGDLPQLTVSGPMRAVVGSLLRKKASKRPTIAEAKQLLQKITDQASAATATHTKAETPRQPRLKQVLIASGSVVVVATMVVWFFLPAEEPGQKKDKTSPSTSVSTTRSTSSSSPSTATSMAPSPSPSRSYWFTDDSVLGKVYNDADLTFVMAEDWEVEPSGDEHEVRVNTGDGNIYTIRPIGIGNLRSTAEEKHKESWNSDESKVEYVNANYAAWSSTMPALCSSFRCPSGTVSHFATSIERKPIGKMVMITVTSVTTNPDTSYDKDQREDLAVFGKRVDYTH